MALNSFCDQTLHLFLFPFFHFTSILPHFHIYCQQPPTSSKVIWFLYECILEFKRDLNYYPDFLPVFDKISTGFKPLQSQAACGRIIPTKYALSVKGKAWNFHYHNMSLEILLGKCMVSSHNYWQNLYRRLILISPLCLSRAQ